MFRWKTLYYPIDAAQGPLEDKNQAVRENSGVGPSEILPASDEGDEAACISRLCRGRDPLERVCRSVGATGCFLATSRQSLFTELLGMLRAGIDP